MTDEEIKAKYPVYHEAMRAARELGVVLVRVGDDKARSGEPRLFQFCEGGPEMRIHHDDCPPRTSEGGCE